MIRDLGASPRLRSADFPAALLDGTALLHLTDYSFLERARMAVICPLWAGVTTASELSIAIVRALEQMGIMVDDVETRHPSLDDLFYAGPPALDLRGDTMTGGNMDDAAEPPPPWRRPRFRE